MSIEEEFELLENTSTDSNLEQFEESLLQLDTSTFALHKHAFEQFEVIFVVEVLLLFKIADSRLKQLIE